ncbi:MAG: ABC transporter permease [Methanobacteriota archaeon]|nr:MAG: ABC transporter permease [Euryarchaeota archaeon]
MKSPPAAVGLIIVLIYLGIVIYDQFWVPNNDVMIANFSATGPDPPFWWPGGKAAGGWMGTTFPGIDLADAVLKAVRIDLIYSTFVVLTGALVGSLIGVVAGFRGGLFDEALMRGTDVTYSIPFLVFAIAVAFALQKRDFLTINMILLILWWPPYARLVRAQSLSVKELKFVEAARAAGASDARIMLRHVLPNTLAPVFVQISLDLGVVTQIFAALEFIGFNAGNLFLPELGNLINIGWTWGFESHPWTILMPGIALLIFTVSVNLLGDGLRDVLDPRARR